MKNIQIAPAFTYNLTFAISFLLAGYIFEAWIYYVIAIVFISCLFRFKEE